MNNPQPHSCAFGCICRQQRMEDCYFVLTGFPIVTVCYSLHTLNFLRKRDDLLQSLPSQLSSVNLLLHKLLPHLSCSLLHAPLCSHSFPRKNNQHSEFGCQSKLFQGLVVPFRQNLGFGKEEEGKTRHRYVPDMLFFLSHPASTSETV